MKNSREMADAVFRIRDEYTEKKRRRKEAVKRAALTGVPVFAAFALVIGIGASFDRREIGTGSTPVTTAVTSADTAEAAAEETNALKETAASGKSKSTRKETKPVTSQALEGEAVETMIPESAPETQPEVFTAPTETEQTAATTTAATTFTTTRALTENGAEPAEEHRASPDTETDAVPVTTTTTAAAAVNEAVIFGLNELCELYPTLHIDGLGDYACTGETAAADTLGEALAETAVGDGAEHAVIYSLENGQIAVRYGETDYYIVYKAKEDQ